MGLGSRKGRGGGAGLGARGRGGAGALTLFGRQGVLLLRLRFLQLGLIEAGDFPHVRLVCHFLKAILVGKARRLACGRGQRPLRLSADASRRGARPGRSQHPQAEDLGASRTPFLALGRGPPTGRPVGEGRLLRLPRAGQVHPLRPHPDGAPALGSAHRGVPLRA